MKSPSLLLVDDDRHVLESMCAWLREKGYSVATAADCAEAKAQISRKAFDLILADIHLTDGDGFDVLAYARANRPSTTVILVTGDRKSTRLNFSHIPLSRMPSSA